MIYEGNNRKLNKEKDELNKNYNRLKNELNKKIKN